MDQARLTGCSLLDLIEHEAEEREHDEAEGVRLAYVVARARVWRRGRRGIVILRSRAAELLHD